MALHEGAPGLGPCPVPVPVPAVDVVVAAFVVLQAGGGGSFCFQRKPKVTSRVDVVVL